MVGERNDLVKKKKKGKTESVVPHFAQERLERAYVSSDCTS